MKGPYTLGWIHNDITLNTVASGPLHMTYYHTHRYSITYIDTVQGRISPLYGADLTWSACGSVGRSPRGSKQRAPYTRLTMCMRPKA